MSSFHDQRVCVCTYGLRPVTLLERCPHFRGCYVQELGPESSVSLLEQDLGPKDVVCVLYVQYDCHWCSVSVLVCTCIYIVYTYI